MADASEPMAPPPSRVVNGALGFGGAVAGGTAGHFLFGWLLHQGFYAPAVPGALLGLGCGMAIRRRSPPLAVACGFLALGLGIFTRWVYDAGGDSLPRFVARLLQLTPLTLIMLVLGAVCGFWFALGGPSKRITPAGSAPST